MNCKAEPKFKPLVWNLANDRVVEAVIVWEIQTAFRAMRRQDEVFRKLMQYKYYENKLHMDLKISSCKINMY